MSFVKVHAGVEQVKVPDTVCPCGDYDSTITALSACYDATSPCEDYGITTYVNIRDYLISNS